MVVRLDPSQQKNVISIFLEMASVAHSENHFVGGTRDIVESSFCTSRDLRYVYSEIKSHISEIFSDAEMTEFRMRLAAAGVTPALFEVDVEKLLRKKSLTKECDFRQLLEAVESRSELGMTTSQVEAANALLAEFEQRVAGAAQVKRSEIRVKESE
jgi:hypothetical protein